MKIAMPSAIGVEISSARIDEYSVPQMKGRAPNCRDRVPDVRLPELPAELLNRQRRLTSELERDGRDDQDQQQCERTRPDAKEKFVGTGGNARSVSRHLQS